MPHPDGHIDELAGRILDGAPIDWSTLSAETDGEQRVLDNLKIVARIASLHSSPSLLSSLTSGTSGVLEDGRHIQLLPGQMWGHLRVREYVGRGRFGVVYRAFATTLEREVALKVLSHRNATSGTDVAHEGRMMARVHHPNVVTVFGAQVIGHEVGIW